MTIEIGYALSSEEHRPEDLIRNAQAAEAAGFGFAFISDHFHPWIDRQGQSSFVWSVIGAIAATTSKLRLGTGVTCPTIRIHPAIVAQAAATTAAMMPGRFSLGLGTGENLNEHILGDHWPSEVEVRQRMLEEAIEVIRTLWEGGYQSYEGEFYTVENARLYTLSDEPPPILIAADGEHAAELAARVGDGLITTAPKAELVDLIEKSERPDRPRIGQVGLSWAETKKAAVKTALEWWPTAAIRGDVGAELPLPRQFEQLAEMVTEDQIAESLVCGPDPEPILEKVKAYEDAGYTQVYLHQVGPDQDGFLRFAKRELLPKVA
jgi:coenzyme F420-dependent glucose-6-phosphate dehydrogenase